MIEDGFECPSPTPCDGIVELPLIRLLRGRDLKDATDVFGDLSPRDTERLWARLQWQNGLDLWGEGAKEDLGSVTELTNGGGGSMTLVNDGTFELVSGGGVHRSDCSPVFWKEVGT